MYLDNLEKYKDNKYIMKMSRECGTYPHLYMFWKEHLFERVQKIFVWDCGDLKQKHIEIPLLLNGFVGITDYKQKITAFNCSMSGVTIYPDEFSIANVHSPIYTDTYNIVNSKDLPKGMNTKTGKDIVIIDNTDLRNPMYPLIHHYAMLLAHADVTLMDALINIRDNGKVPIAKDEVTKKSIIDYQYKVFNGQYGVISDSNLMGIEYVGSASSNGQTLKEIFEVREKLIKSFYQAIGVRGAFEKNNNAVDLEVTSDSTLLQLNLHDMLDCRERGCELVNNTFGTNWSVKLADEINNQFIERSIEDENSKRDVSENESITDSAIE